MARKGKRKEIGIPGSVLLIILLAIALGLGYYGLSQTPTATTQAPLTNTTLTNTSVINITTTAENTSIKTHNVTVTPLK